MFEKVLVRHTTRQTWSLIEADAHAGLVRRGLIWRAGDVWCMDARADAALETIEWAVCDFCNARPVAWDIDAETFETSIGLRSVGGWMACAPCGAAIATGDRAALEARSVGYVQRESREPAVAVPLQRTLLAQFWQHLRSIRPTSTR